MELDEVRFKYLSLNTMCAAILKTEQLDRPENLVKWAGIESKEEITKMAISVTRLITSCEYIVIKERVDLNESQLPILATLIIASPSKVKDFYSFNSKNVGLPPSCLLRVMHSDNLLVNHATLRIEVSTKETTISKNLYYNKDFLLSQ